MTVRRLELDYVAAPRRPRWPGFTLLALSLGLAAHLGLRYTDARHELLRLQTERSLVPQQQPRPVRALPPEQIEDLMKNAEGVARQLALPWATVISALEQASSPDVALLRLQPDSEHRLLRLTGEARTRDAMFAYVRRLSDANRLGEVHLLSHQVEKEHPQRPVQFSVQAALR